MSIRVAIAHKTFYKFDRLVSLSPHSIRLRPAPHCQPKIHSYSLKIMPEQHFINWQQDAFGNFLARVVFPEKTHHIVSLSTVGLSKPEIELVKNKHLILIEFSWSS